MPDPGLGPREAAAGTAETPDLVGRQAVGGMNRQLSLCIWRCRNKAVGGVVGRSGGRGQVSPVRSFIIADLEVGGVTGCLHTCACVCARGEWGRRAFKPRLERAHGAGPLELFWCRPLEPSVPPRRRDGPPRQH